MHHQIQCEDTTLQPIGDISLGEYRLQKIPPNKLEQKTVYE